MMVPVKHPRHPSLYQVNTRIWLGELSLKLGRPATLDDTPDADLDALAALGFDWLWPLGIWQTGPVGRAVAWADPDLQREYRALLPDFTETDVSGSPFAVQSYSVHADFGGDAALQRLRPRLAARGINLMLDFVPNHTALDHPWIVQHPEYYIGGTDDDLTRDPHNWFRAPERRIIAHGRDPNFPGWTDTAQLNYRCAGLRFAQIEQLLSIASRCDGVRCDMAMLLLPDVIARTWGGRSHPADGSLPSDDPWWPEAIQAVKARNPNFTFLAEAYWDREWDLQQQGFDFTYDKRFYDRLRERNAESVRGHLHADADFMRHSMRFLENHDEPRAAAVFPLDVHRAAATIAMLVPGMRLVHDGQTKGRTQRAIIQLNRQPQELTNPELAEFYGGLLAVMRLPAVQQGEWRLLDAPSANGNAVIAFAWQRGVERVIVVVNYGGTATPCAIPLPEISNDRRALSLDDGLSDLQMECTGELRLDLQPWQAHAFTVSCVY
jgi:glycosidase